MSEIYTHENAYEQYKNQIEGLVQDTLSDDIKRESVRQELLNQANSNHWWFLRYVCDFTDIETACHLEFSKRYQSRSHRNFTLYLLPRSHLKTTCITVGGTLWNAVRPVVVEPGGRKKHGSDLRQLIYGGTIKKARSFVKDIKSIVINSPMFAWLYPEFVPDDAWRAGRGRGNWNDDRIDFPNSKQAGRKEGNVEAASVGADRTGFHYDVMVYDDVVHDENVNSLEMRNNVYDWFKNTYQVRDNPINSRMVLIGTRWHFDDLYGRLIREEEKSREECHPADLLIYTRYAVEKGKPIWHERFTLESLDKLKRQLGSYIYSCQYDNNPIAEEDAIFRREHIKTVERWEIPTQLTRTVAVDMADEESTRGDWCVITTGGMDSLGNFYVLDIQRGKFSTDTILDHIKRACVRFRPIAVGVETTGFQKTILRQYRKTVKGLGYSVPFVEMNRGKSSKLQRALGLQPRLENGQFFIAEDIKDYAVAIEELVQFPAGRHDDIVDTIVDCEMLCGQPRGESEIPKNPGIGLASLFGPLYTDETEVNSVARFNGYN